MPIIINELVFKGTVATASTATKEGGREKPQPEVNQKLLLELCVEEVLKVLAQQKER